MTMGWARTRRLLGDQRGKRGFAIVLVAALAGLIFLLGASLVAISRLQSAAANYDQRMRLARDHARMSLDLAIARLQETLGEDKAVSFQADVYRNLEDDDFKIATVPDGGNFLVKHPFWLGTFTPGDLSPDWVTTLPMNSDFDGNGVDPFVDYEGLGIPTVTLVGPGTATPLEVDTDRWKIEVKVPKEQIQVKGALGFTDDRTIGNYAFWVGDLGTKASYAWYDEKAYVDHNEYVASKAERLQQLRIASPGFPTVDTNATPNPDRIEDDFVNDFQFRSRWGNASNVERFLVGLEEERDGDDAGSEPDYEVSKYFHDFTPLAKGLLTNSANGGFRSDASTLAMTGVSNWDAYYYPYAKLAKAAVSTSSGYVDDKFPIAAKSADAPLIAPVITEFNLNYSMYLSSAAEGAQDLTLSFAGAVELWNPFSSAIDLGSDSLIVEVTGLPELSVRINGIAEPVSWAGELGTLSKLPTFEISNIGGNGTNVLRPGQIVVFSGPAASAATDFAPYDLQFGPTSIGVSTDRVQLLVGTATVPAGGADQLYGTFTAAADLRVKLYRKQASPETLTQLAEYILPSPFESPTSAVTDVTGVGSPSFGFSWKIDDAALEPDQDFLPANPVLSSSHLMDFSPADTSLPVNLSPGFSNAATQILGHNHTDISGSLDTSFDVSFLQLPKQEIGSVSHLSGAYGETLITIPIGEPGAPDNVLFDQYFFSTVPKDAGDWKPVDPLPNSGYEPVVNAIQEDLAASDSAEHLYVEGMFNVHSTSIDSWAALLKGSPASRSDFWISVFEPLETDDPENSTLDTELYLFFNQPFGAEDRYDPYLNPTPVDGLITAEELRASLNQAVVALTGPQVDVLAKHIVSNIRKRFQGNAPYAGLNQGPFTSLRDFVDSGVLQNAIAGANVDLSGAINPDWVVPSTPRAFRQSTILNLIAPYLSVRSDTFLIRAYGDAVDPADPGKIWARAYCEAVVQRTHQVHNASHPNLGRRFKIVAFRWLSPSEI